MSRKKPIRHQVSQYTRKGGVKVRSHARGHGQKEAKEAKPMARYYTPYPELNGYEFLSGDLDWRQYGAKWYKYHPGDDWATVIELVNMRDAVDEHYPQKYMVTVQSVGWSDGKELRRALETIGEEHQKNPSVGMKIEAMHAYGGNDLISDDYGNNAKEMVEAAMEMN